MPVTIKPASHGAAAVLQYGRQGQSFVRDSLDLLNKACYPENEMSKELLQSSFSIKEEDRIGPSSNGFVHGAIRAYNQHHCLHIRPEDVWFAILTQLNLYINAHAEELRGHFVAHDGKKELKLEFIGTRSSFDFSLFAKHMGGLIEEHIVDLELRRWMMPAFTTTTETDIVVASILLMGATREYFNFKCLLRCGLPSVTLLGTKADWELILSRLERLKEYGEEPAQFYDLLKPILRRFVQSFEAPLAKDTINFWQRIAHFTPGGSGPSYYSGWITAFCFWDREGKSMYQLGKNSYLSRWAGEGPGELELDGVVYHWIDSNQVPPGYTSVPAKVDDNGNEFEATLIAGSVGMRYFIDEGTGPDLNTIKPESGWWMFEKKTEKEEAIEESK